MIGLEDRQSLAHDIHTAHKAGARLRLACETAGIDVRTLARASSRAMAGPIRYARNPPMR
jgi:putative transposase